MSLFATPTPPSHLVHFKAGKCVREGNMLKPDVRKGLIYMDQDDTSLLHFYWKERTAGQPEEDLIIFPDEADFVKVDECTTGRVYLLRFKSSNQKLFFWMQDSSDAKDAEVVEKVNRLINDPESAMAERGETNTEGPSPAQVLNMLGGEQGIDQDQLFQYLQTVGGFGGAVAAPTTTGGDGPRRQSSIPSQGRPTTTEHAVLNDSVIQDLGEALNGVDMSSAESIPQDEEERLHAVLQPAAIGPLLRDGKLARALFPDAIPADMNLSSEDNVRQLTSADIFKDRLRRIHLGLRQGRLDRYTSLLNLEAESGEYGIEHFLTALEDQARQRQTQSEDVAMDED
ncbi:hypothetical protein BZG36_01967 [Bifiguratus adelaidae]|uniref:Pru domain-containing protein n=1 Tax=Bifiguratus adelaidae TaxID=1938954 RepID=A0A261Y3R8_9FUNG|nr:hypothetical protein BZG36_01967 [Bifiguratus adelaidae]